jgi:hypothetical protein
MMPLTAFAANLIIIAVFTAINTDVIAVNVANIVVFNVFVTMLATACIPVYAFGAPAFAAFALVGVNFCCIVTPKDVVATLASFKQLVEAIFAIPFIVAAKAHIAQSYNFTAIMANAVFVGTVWAKPNALDITPAVLNGFKLSAVENLVAIFTSEFHFFQF